MGFTYNGPKFKSLFFKVSEFNCGNRRLKSPSKIWTPICCSGHQQWLEVLCDLIDSRVDRDPTPKIGMKFSCQFIDERSFPTTERKKNPQIGVDGIFRTLGVSSFHPMYSNCLLTTIIVYRPPPFINGPSFLEPLEMRWKRRVMNYDVYHVLQRRVPTAYRSFVKKCTTGQISAFCPAFYRSPKCLL